jgi:hypothetical protein
LEDNTGGQTRGEVEKVNVTWHLKNDRGDGISFFHRLIKT